MKVQFGTDRFHKCIEMNDILTLIMLSVTIVILQFGFENGHCF